MTTRGQVLLDLAEYLAMAAGVYFGMKGRMPWVAALVPLVLLGPFWLHRFMKWRRKQRSWSSNRA